MKKILCIGSMAVDILVSGVEKLPKPGLLLNVKNTSITTGGCASNTAIDLKKLGIETDLICRIGDDFFGEFFLNTIKDVSLSSEGIFIGKNSSTTSSIVFINENGERSFLYNSGSTGEFIFDNINLEMVDNADIIFIGGSLLLESFDGKGCEDFLKYCKQKNKYTVMDTAWDFNGEWLPKIQSSIQYLDLFMPSFDEAFMLTNKKNLDEIVDIFFELGSKSVLIKLGENGAFVAENFNKRYTVDSFQVDKVIDTTGAGDSFCAGFLSGLSLGYDFKTCATLGNAVGAFCIQSVGATCGIKELKDVFDFIKNERGIAIGE